MRKDEERLQIQISSFLRLQYPRLIFTFDASGLKLPIGLAVKATKMRSGRGIPDMIIFRPNNKYHGLFLEIKNGREDVYNKNNKIKKSTHLAEQIKIMDSLNKSGYYATFAFGYDDAIHIIQSYMANKDA